MGSSICLVGFDIDNIDKVKGWDGFVSPDGIFYKVTERTAIEAAHDDFVEVFTDIILHTDIMKTYENIKIEKPEFQGHHMSYKDAFINILGYINFEHIGGTKVEIVCPKYRMNNKKINNKQIKTLIKLLEINGDSSDNMFQIFNQFDNLHDVNIHTSRNR